MAVPSEHCFASAGAAPLHVVHFAPFWSCPPFWPSDTAPPQATSIPKVRIIEAKVEAFMVMSPVR